MSVCCVGNNIYENIADEPDDYADMSSGSFQADITPPPTGRHHIYTNDSHHQPSYANGSGTDEGVTATLNRPPAHIMRRPRMPPPQPPTIPVTAATTSPAPPSAMVTINGVTLASNNT